MNGKALYVITSAVDKREYQRISMCETAYDAWRILEAVHEGTSEVKESRLQMLASKFESLKMGEDEIIAAYYAKMKEITNQAATYGKVYKETKMVKKMLRTLPKRFRMKVAEIEESRNLKDIRIDDLIGSLETWELKLQEEKDDQEGEIFTAKKNDLTLKTVGRRRTESDSED